MRWYWKKLGLLYSPASPDRHPKLQTHAANPLPVHLEGGIYRVFYSGRDKQNRSSVGAVDIDIEQFKIINEHYEPFFEHGPEQSFYADGVSIGNCYEASGKHYILFMGWQNPKNGHWRGDVGRLALKSDLSLELDRDRPFMSTNEQDPISLSYPWVMSSGSGKFDMWYGSTRSWDTGNGEMLHVIQHASSLDGHDWHRSGLAVPFEIGKAQAFSHPTVLPSKDRDGLDMWFSFRSGSGESYRIGYAHSSDGQSWELKLEEAGITISDNGWDSEMVEYPYVFDHKGERYMLYNGNSYGRSGFGLAVLSEH